MKVNVTLNHTQKREVVDYLPVITGATYTETDNYSISTVMGKQFKQIDLKTGVSSFVDVVINIQYRPERFSVSNVLIRSGDAIIKEIKDGRSVNFLVLESEPDTVYIDANNLFSLYYRTEIDAGFTRLDLLEKDGKKDVMISLSSGYTVLLVADKGKYDKDKLLKDRCVLLNKLENEINCRLSDLLEANPPNENKREWLAILMEFYTYLVNLL